MNARITVAIVDQMHSGRTVMQATSRAAFLANAEAEAKGWSVAARAQLLEDFAQTGASIARQVAA